MKSLPHPDSLHKVSLIGAPTDVGASARGASMGPEALRVAGLEPALFNHGLDVEDLGNLTGPHNPWEESTGGYRHLDEVIPWNQSVYDMVYRTLKRERMPILMGGDHSLAIGSISAAARHCRDTGKKLRVLWLDAHADSNTADITPSGNLHGMPIATLCGYDPTELSSLTGDVPTVTPDVFRLIGIRSVDPAEKELVHRINLEVFDMRYIDEVGMFRTVERALAGIDRNTHLHVSFDVDFIDPQIAPGVGTPVMGGPTYREAQLCMEMIADTGLLGSLDIMELNPAFDIRNQTAQLVVELVESLFGKSTLMRKRD